MNPQQLLQRARDGHVANIDFRDFCALVEAFGFILRRSRGSHRVYTRPDVPYRVTMQPLHNGDAKGYQIRQFLEMVEEYDLHLEDRR